MHSQIMDQDSPTSIKMNVEESTNQNHLQDTGDIESVRVEPECSPHAMDGPFNNEIENQNQNQNHLQDTGDIESGRVEPERASHEMDGPLNNEIENQNHLQDTGDIESGRVEPEDASHEMDGPFNNEIENQNHLQDTGDIESGRIDPERASHAVDGPFNNIEGDMEQMDKLYSRLEQCNEEMKAANSAKTLMELRTRTNLDLDNVQKLAKQIDRKLDGLVRTNAAQRKVSGNDSGSVNDQARTTIISGFGERLKEMRVRFQSLRVRMETGHKQAIESRYLSITGEKATAEAIDKLVSNTDIESLLHQATQQHGQGTVLDAVAEIQERRDAMRETRRSLMNLHQTFLGMATPAEGHQVRVTIGVSANPVEIQSGAHAKPVVIVKRRNDYEKEVRRKSYIALALALVACIVIITLNLKFEGTEEIDFDPKVFNVPKR